MLGDTPQPFLTLADTFSRTPPHRESRGGLESVEHYPTEADAIAETNLDHTVSYTYDESGNLETASDDSFIPLGVTNGLLYTYTYDERDRVDTATAHYLPGGDRLLDAGYHRYGHRESLRLSEGGSDYDSSWLRNELGRLTQASFPGGASPTVSFTHYDNDDLEKITHGNGSTTDYVYKPHGPIDTITVADAGTAQLHKLAYTYDALLDVDTITEHIGTAQQTPDYDYDGVLRLTDAVYPSGLGLPASESFPYDAAGNRDDDDQSPTPWSYDVDNRIQASPDRSYVFDEDGNLTQVFDTQPDPDVQIRELEWDFANRLERHTDLTTGEVTTYAYDPFGRRIRRAIASGATTWYLWDGDQLLAEYGSSGSRQVRYAYAGGFAPMQVAQGAPGSEAIYDVHADHLDTPRMLTDSTGTPVWRAAYEAFGQAHLDPANSVTGFNIRFPGQYFDAETGLHYNRFRYYDPAIGRYVSADPIGQAGVIGDVGERSPLGHEPFQALPVRRSGDRVVW